MRHSKRVLFACLLAVAIAAMAACSLVLDFSDCKSDTACVTKYGPNWTCSAQNICEQPRQSACATDADCQGAHAPGWTCTSAGICQEPSPLLGAPCEQSSGDINAANAFNIGVLLPLTGEEEGFGRPLLDAIKLAQADFNGISGVAGRNIGLIICDTEGKDELALSGARHLVDKSRVTAIIGPDYSSQTLEVANQVTIANDVLLVTPSGTATTITNLVDKNLVWRTVASDAVQGEALGQLVRHVLENVIETPLASAKVAVLVRRDDTYATGLSEAVYRHIPAAMIQGGINRFSPRNYPNASAGQGSDYSGVVSQILAEDVEPDLVIVLGSSEAWDIVALLDNVLVQKQPLYFFADAAKNTQQSVRAPQTLAERIWGTAPQNVGESNYPPYLSFRIKFQAAYPGQNPDELQFVANAFDALYLIAFAAAAEGFSGPELARGMAKLSTGAKIHPNQSEAQQAMRLLSDGSTIDYQGASGALDFDENGDPQASPIALWCFENGALPEKGVLLGFDLKFSALRCDAEPGCDDCEDVGLGDVGSDVDADVGRGDVAVDDAGRDVVCTPDCSNRCSGSDGCGGQCVNNCVAPQTCGGGAVRDQCGCTPNCAGKCSGPDGCAEICPNNCIEPANCGAAIIHVCCDAC
ncbi:MAG: ABC transporter substrate-binding protein [Bradymonadaceae bacterium]|nr:ABC transporter substrate-binding protein [Lujinxingiaceae bacterium]